MATLNTTSYVPLTSVFSNICSGVSVPECIFHCTVRWCVLLRLISSTGAVFDKINPLSRKYGKLPQVPPYGVSIRSTRHALLALGVHTEQVAVAARKELQNRSRRRREKAFGISFQ